MGYNLFLDDIRMPAQAANYMHPDIAVLYGTKVWDIVRNYKQFVKHIKRFGIPEIASFDHDLAQIHYEVSSRKESFKYYPETGFDCMKWMVDHIIDNNLEPPQVIVHSMNAVGAENIQRYFNNFIKQYKWDNSKESDTRTAK